MSFYTICGSGGWVCFSICLIDGSYVSALDEHQRSMPFFSSCHTIAFFRGYIFGKGRLIPAETSRHAASGWWGAPGFYFVLFINFFFATMRKREESPKNFNPTPPHSPRFISCSGLHLRFSQLCYNSFLLGLLSRSCSAAPGRVSLLFRLRCTTHMAECCVEVFKHL